MARLPTTQNNEPYLLESFTPAQVKLRELEATGDYVFLSFGRDSLNQTYDRDFKVYRIDPRRLYKVVGTTPTGTRITFDPQGPGKTFANDRSIRAALQAPEQSMTLAGRCVFAKTATYGCCRERTKRIFPLPDPNKPCSTNQSKRSVFD